MRVSTVGAAVLVLLGCASQELGTSAPDDASPDVAAGAASGAQRRAGQDAAMRFASTMSDATSSVDPRELARDVGGGSGDRDVGAGSDESGARGLDPGPRPEDSGGVADLPVEAPVPSGLACERHADCGAGICVPAPTGRVCSAPCEQSCEAGWVCRKVGDGHGGELSVCVHRTVHLCRPCRSHSECRLLGGEQGAWCVEAAAGEGAFCGLPCGAEAACPAGYSCERYKDLATGAVLHQCLPKSGTCECNGHAIAEAAWTLCRKEHCYGERRCTEEGLSPCDVQAPAPEVCNAVDDDCDGETDEDFRTGGYLLELDHCGSCGLTCRDAVRNGRAECRLREGGPACVLAECRPGYEPAGEDRCAPSGARFCEPCDAETPCALNLKCVRLGDGRRCLEPCMVDADNCGHGLSCRRLGPPAGGLCVPEGGACPD